MPSSYNAKPFLKWAGGKSQLLPTLEALVPEECTTYLEPFCGGGAMLFFLLQRYPSIRKAIISDINLNLIKTYLIIKDKPLLLIETLEEIEHRYKSLPSEEYRKDFYLEIRQVFNASISDDVRQAAYMIFLNKTCFNGLYRENRKGEFNVPFGRYKNPTICNPEVIMADNRILSRVTILHGDYSLIKPFVDNKSFIYFDPPYRPVSETSNFTSYNNSSFNDHEQMRLATFFNALNELDCKMMLSNSDGSDSFLQEIYRDYIISRVSAKRCINSNAAKRGAISELIIRNYQ